MLRNLYITAIEPGSGKSLVVLGMMELLSKRVKKLGFFRPIIHTDHSLDTDIALVQSRYQLAFPYEACYALTASVAQQLIADGQYDELLKRVIEKYKALERHCEFVVCEGSDAIDVDPAFADNLNGQLANHLAAPLLLVTNGHGKPPADVVRMVQTEREAFVAEGCDLAAIVVNRAAIDQRDQIQQKLLESYPDADTASELILVLPEQAILSQPTVAEVMTALGGTLVHGQPEQLNREVSGFKAAAMQVPNFLHHLHNGSLVIVPGDRSDIVLGCLAAFFSEHYPTASGIILTGGVPLAPEIHHLIDGINWPIPIVQVQPDTYETATIISSVEAVITPDNTRKIASALGLFETYVDATAIEQRIAISRSERMTPLMFEYDLIERARSIKQHIVLPEGNDERILRAADTLIRRGVVEITLLGDEAQIRSQIASLDLQLQDVQILNPLQSDCHDKFAATYFDLRQHKGITKDYAHDVMRDVSYFGTMMVYEGLADGMVSGAQHTTAHTIRPALEFIRPRPDCSIVSSVFLMCLDDRVLVYGDCAVNPNPTPEQLADIAISSAETAHLFGIDARIAMLSYSTGESGSGEDVDKVKQATHLVTTLRPDLKVAGPIQYDAAIDEQVAKTKLPNSTVAGHATVFIFPDLNTGNNTYKAVQRSANAVAIGPILQGLRKPVNDLSRGCTVADIVNTVAITAIQAQRTT